MTITKNVWYEVRYQESLKLDNRVLVRPKTVCFLKRKKAEEFFNSLPADCTRWLVLCEESICDVVYSKN